ncbi:carbohydrate ABC transporter permease, partial [Shewanella algae]
MLYRVALPLSLLVWLLPLLAIALTSTRTLDDLSRGNYWGWPTDIRVIQNYTAVFTSSPMGRYLLNSIVITLPAVAGTLAISTMAGFAL